MVDTREALQTLWKGKCTIYIQEETTNPINKRTEFKEVDIYKDEPCKLSFENITTVNESNNAAIVIQKAKLFIGPEINIPPGSKVVVTQNNVTSEYEKSGKPGVYSNHQEIQLDLFKGWS